MKTFVQLTPCLGILAIIVMTVPPAFGATSKSGAKQLFESKCSQCHGPNGKGIAAIHSPNFTSPKWEAEHSDQRIISMITNGEKGTMMPA